MTETEERWARERLATRDMVRALIHDMEVQSQNERLPMALRKKAKRFLDTYNKDREYCEFNKAFLKRLNKFWYNELYNRTEEKEEQPELF